MGVVRRVADIHAGADRLLARLRSERGLSLVELVLVLAIMGVVLASLTKLFVGGNKVGVDLGARFQAQSGVRVALDRLRSDVRCARAVSGGPTSVTLTLPTTCANGGGSVSWCTVASGSHWSLYRKAAATCDASGVRWADHVATASVFSVYAQSPTSLGKLAVDLPVNARPRTRLDGFELQDTIVLRNSARS
jgi:prepilin-type N-terminal cleavage/methylation domain-containing protein